MHSSNQSEKHSLDELSHVIRQVEEFQAEGYLAKVTQRFKDASNALKSAILFCVDSGASDHICAQLEAFETLDRNAPSKLFKVVHGTARIRSEGKGTVMLPVELPNGKVVNIRLHDVYYIPSQPFNLISVPRCIDEGWDDPKFSKCSWEFKGIQVTLARHGNYFVGLPTAEQNYLCPAVAEDAFSSKMEQSVSLEGAKGPMQPSKQSHLESKKQVSEAHYRRNVANRPFREKADWQFSKTEYQKWANELGDSRGRFHCDLFTDGKGPVDGNAQEPKFYSAQDDAFNHYWGGKFCWGNPVFEAEF